MCQKKITNFLPVKKKKPKNTPAYYQCLLNASLQGFQGQKITSVCRNCKNNGSNLMEERESQIQLLIQAYQQLGSSLKSLLTPLNDVSHP